MNVQLIRSLGLCSGCGACTVICPHNALKMTRTIGINAPIVVETQCIDCQKCLDVCPGYDNYLHLLEKKNKRINKPNRTINKSYISFATDSTIRSESSSGGYITALLLSLLENKTISGIITLKRDFSDPFEYYGGVIKDVEKLKESQGSIYYPVSVCEGLREIINLDGRFAFVGKPCEVHAARLLSCKMKSLEHKIPLFISLFCHHTPTRTSNRVLLRKLKLPLDDIKLIKYRGRGWPGYFQIFGKNGECLFSSPYRNIWDNYLSSEMPISCQVCFDPYGEYADISVGDAWGFVDETGLGLSAVLLRTREGIYFHNIAQKNGSISCLENTPQNIFLGQSPLQQKKRNERLVRELYQLKYNLNLNNVLNFLLKRRITLKNKSRVIYLLLKIIQSS